MAAATTTADWLTTTQAQIEAFCQAHKVVVGSTERTIAASFEIGCLHALLRFYETHGYDASVQNLGPGNVYRYLTTPSGNPHNFSYIRLTKRKCRFELRQQVRVQSTASKHIRFTPDLVVVRVGARIAGRKNATYASGRRRFYYVSADNVIAAHECKSMNPFPELMVSFIGMLRIAHHWLEGDTDVVVSRQGDHLAPTLFVGGSLRPFHKPMVKALQRLFPLNIVSGLHAGTWNIGDSKNRLKIKPRLRQRHNPVPKSTTVVDAGSQIAGASTN